ncbi:MAG: DUF456 domain-containing protein [Candidatus Azobacteroides sp.]|nr:DUF456 domain-containing protein [Candidatus Azobacteroides sp.]
MDTVLIVIGIVLLLGGIAGCIVPLLPGPPLAYCSLILLQFTHFHPFTLNFLILWAVVVLVVTLLDYYVPIWGTKHFGGTKGGTWGSTIGLIAGLFFPPLGILLGPLAGAFVGEIVNRQDMRTAFRSAIGAFIGFLAGTLMKLAICGALAFYFIKGIL